MSSIQETLVISVFLVVLFGAVSFYLYSRLSYSEKRVGLMESMLMDIKMAIESSEQAHEHSLPLVPPLPPTALFTPPAPLENDDVQDLPEEAFYSSVLAAATEEGEAEAEAEAETETQLVKQLEAQESVVPKVVKVVPNYDAMKKDELQKLAEQRGLRVRKTSGKGEIITLLRKNDTNNTTPSSSGTDNASEPVESMLASSTDAATGFPLDMEQDGIESA
jgi:hypothetical protein